MRPDRGGCGVTINEGMTTKDEKDPDTSGRC